MAELQVSTGGGKNFPVWVGSLRENVTEAHLKETFGVQGEVVTCRVMVDEWGKSRYVVMRIP